MFQIESHRTVNDPTERLRRLALLFGVFENAADSQVVEAQESAASDQTAETARPVNLSTTQRNKQNGGDV